MGRRAPILPSARRAALAGLLGLALGVLGAGAGTAAGTDQTRVLCASPRVTCSVQVASTWTEGGTGEVSVTGAPGVTVELRAFRAEVSDGAVDALHPLGKPVVISTDTHGFGVADLALPLLEEGQPGGPLLIAAADAVATDLDRVVGAWAVLTARTPLILGDGWATARPVGTPLGLRIEAAIGGTAFDVEYLTGGSWQSAGPPRPGTCPAAGGCTVDYQVPRGLTATEHEFRLVNLTTGTSVGTWQVLPSDTGEPAEDPAPTRVPPVGAAVEHSFRPGKGAGTAPVPRPRSENLDRSQEALGAVGDAAGHRVAPVLVAAGAATALALLSLVVMIGRRRG